MNVPDMMPIKSEEITSFVAKANTMAITGGKIESQPALKDSIWFVPKKIKGELRILTTGNVYVSIYL